jgi:hypothetical protein
MLSIPPATATERSPALMAWSAMVTARMPEAQTLLIVSEGSSKGRPASTAAWREGTCPLPACRTSPMNECSKSCGASPERSTACLMA